MREGWKRGGWKACGRVKMGCIMTPMPNYLSTLKLHHNRVENTLKPTKTAQNSVGKKSGAVWKGRSVDEMVWMKNVVE